MPMDKAHKQTDKQLEKIERRLTKIYEDASFELSASWNDYMSKVENKSAELLKAIDEATDDERKSKAKKEYQRFLRSSTLRDRRYAQMVEETAVQLYNVNSTAVAYINGQLPETYVLHLNWQNERFAAEVKGYSYTLVDKNTVKHLASTKKSLLPFKKLNKKKDIKWNTKKLNSEVLQGILQGESVPKIAKRLEKVQNMNRDASIRSARTMITAAENKGRMESYRQATENGIILKREWIATHDSKTRDWHAELDGRLADVDEYFENSIGLILYPGDPSADPANVYNCRCTMGAKIIGFKKVKR
jgi:SPP1 gp7 family putative phage head morphogenesis protein